ncbi:MAG: exodeoxyribonuclease III [Lachnospiraceae bacterium]|jgi:exodeoxyribonuclease-3|nr:exodeoxyribonuclease III [Lachnospiraceae bacterium]
MKFISWNVNGIRACVGKGFLDFFRREDADFFCIQESKLQAGQIDLALPGYHQYWNYAEKKGYSGTAVFCKEEPINVTYGIDASMNCDNLVHNHEGRIITVEMADFYLITVYTPNSKDQLLRLDYRMEWEDAFRQYLKELAEKKPLIICGDLNVAHHEIDLKNPATNRRNPGFTDEERSKLSELLDSGFVDTFRYFYPEQTDAYTWWSYRMNARVRNVGWRIDYFLVSDTLKNRLADAMIYPDILGSDHCPVGITLIE